MIQASIGKQFPAARESAAFSLDVSFEARRGVTVLFGPSGAGKTLVLDCIAGLRSSRHGGASSSMTCSCSMAKPA